MKKLVPNHCCSGVLEMRNRGGPCQNLNQFVRVYKEDVLWL